MMTDRETNRILVEKCMDFCCKKLCDSDCIPQKGVFPDYRVSFNFRGSNNEAGFLFEHQYGSIRRLRFIVTRRGSDLAAFYYMQKGTNRELTEYLSDKSRIDAFLDDFQHLSDLVDDKHS